MLHISGPLILFSIAASTVYACNSLLSTVGRMPPFS
jgi:hypothetical protein